MVLPLRPRALDNLLRSPDSIASFDRQGTLKMKKPQVISAQAQNRRGPMKYMLSVDLAKVTVWARRKQAAIEARIPTPNMIEIPIFFCQFMWRLQIIFCGSKNMHTSEMTCTLAEQSITSGSE